MYGKQTHLVDAGVFERGPSVAGDLPGGASEPLPASEGGGVSAV